jgi:hypothetical protein
MTITKTRRDSRTSCARGQRPHPRAGKRASLSSKPVIEASQGWAKAPPRRSQRAALTGTGSPACSKHAVLEARRSRQATEPPDRAGPLPKKQDSRAVCPVVVGGSLPPPGTRRRPDSNKGDTTRSLTTHPVNVD